MKKEFIESNISKIKANKIEFKDPLRVFASVCKIVDRAFISPQELNDSRVKDVYLKYAQEWYEKLTSRYHVFSRDAMIQAIMKELGYRDEDTLIGLTVGKMEVEKTIEEMLSLN